MVKVYIYSRKHTLLATLNQNGWMNLVVKYFSHSGSNAKGVAILVTNNLYININSTLNDSNGRFILHDNNNNFFIKNYILNQRVHSNMISMKHT